MDAAAEAPPAPAAPPAAAPPPAGVPATPTPRPPNEAQLPTAVTPAKPGSAREKMLNAAKEKYGAPDPKPVPKPGEAPRPGETPPKPAEGKVDPPKPGDAPEPAAGDKPEKKGVGEGWRRYEEEKKKRVELEQRLETSKTSALAEEERTEYLSRIEKLETARKADQDELRFRAYEKSEEFQTKYEQPYKQAWDKAIKELREVPIIGEDGATTRPMRPEDILDLVNLGLPDARRLAKEKWGYFADDAMAARQDIKRMFDARTEALEEAKKNGAEREKQFKERNQKWQSETTKFIGEKWNGFNQAALKDPKIGEFLNPVEGDDTRNQLLGKGFALVDKAFAANPMDPKLTPQQREEAIRDHARVRNRAAAYGPMRHEITKLRAEVEQLRKANGQFKESTPPTGGGGTETNGRPAATSAREAMRQAGLKHVRPGAM